MTFATLHAAAALPEIFIALAACAILVVGVVAGPNTDSGDENGNEKRADRVNLLCYWLTVATLLATSAWMIADFSLADKTIAFNGMFVADPLAKLLKIAICGLSALAFLYSRRYNRDRNIFKNEYYILGLFAVAGMMVMSSANHLLTLYLGLELMSLCLYAMIACHRNDKLAAEAAMKYFVLGALASSMLLYGMSLLYGLTGSLELSAIQVTLSAADHGDVAVALAVVFIVVALAFKLGAVPFHMWLPDVYHGAPTSTTAFLGAAPKIAAFAIVMRLLIGGLEDLLAMWQPMLILLALLSVAAGNIIAIAQRNLKRMLAYSTISHMGFFLFGILSGSTEGYSASLFYVVIYAVMSIGAFGVILCLASADNESDQLNDLKGLSKRDPLMAILVLILMLSMAGIPPTAGFFAKFSVIHALVRADLVWVAVLAVLLAVIGAFYYLRIIKLAYFDAPDDAQPLGTLANNPPDAKWLLAGNAIIIVAIVPWINGLITACNEVIRHFGG